MTEDVVASVIEKGKKVERNDDDIPLLRESRTKKRKLKKCNVLGKLDAGILIRFSHLKNLNL